MPDAPVGERRVAPDAIPDGLTLAAFNTDCPQPTLDLLGDTLGAFLDIEDVTVGTTLTDDQPEEFAVLHDDVLVDGALVHSGREGDSIAGAASPDVSSATATSGGAASATAASTAAAFQPVDTLFLVGYGDRAGLRALSNRVETLAWRAGRGRLYVAGQQRFAAMDDQWEAYASIADEGVEIHVFEEADYVPVEPDRFVVRGERHSLAGTWLVAYDGDGNDAAKAALVAVEREPDSYYGVWTRIPALVDRIIERAPEYTPVER